jgi:hypothetical protein
MRNSRPPEGPEGQGLSPLFSQQQRSCQRLRPGACESSQNDLDYDYLGVSENGIPLTCSLGCFTKHFIEKIGYKMVLRQPTSRQQVGTLYEMTSPSSLWNASPQTTRVQRHAARHRATTQLSSIKCCSNLGVVFEALLQYGKTYVYKMPFPQAVANPSDLIHWRSDVQLVWL